MTIKNVKVGETYQAKVSGRLAKVRIQEKLEIGLLSESSLKKDWLRPEEDEAWGDL